ncbi:MAG TPA: MBL fold metallo-hydrolase [Vicinamibacterales bacterium]|jgi:glyoxylase-like metal-dependent hydrolase (beta-lactamase superfamily II)|nr:MBL fold metallo-hydrolase [Vicinamibacterales bacterium]
MRSRFALTSLVALLLVAAYGYGQQFGNQPAKLNVVKVRDDLFVIHNDFVPGNTTALVTNEGVVLLDDKFEQDAPNILAMLKTVTNQPVKYVVNTHHHGDHSGGNVQLQKAGAQLIASEQARRYMVDAKQPGQPSVTFVDRALLHLGGKDVELYHFGRAHTGGDVFVYFPADRVLAAGDAFTFGTATPQLIDYQNGGSAKDWTATLDRALQLDFDTVVPGHGDVTTKAELRKFRDSTFAMRTRVHEMLMQKKTKDEISAVLKSDYQGAQLVFPGLLDGLLTELQ